MKRALIFATFAVALVPSLAAAQYARVYTPPAPTVRPYVYSPPPPYRARVDVIDQTGRQSRYDVTVRPLTQTSSRVRSTSWDDGTMTTSTVRQRGPNRVSVYDWSTGDYNTYRIRPTTSPWTAPTYSVYDYDTGTSSRVRVRPRLTRTGGQHG
jgi:hypothetical protein